MDKLVNTIITGDALAVLRTLPDNLVQTCITSPPYFGLRDYGVEGQIGLESSPDAYIARLVEVFREVRRVLKNDGTCWITIGDSYVGGGRGAGGKQEYTQKNMGKPMSVPPGFKPKDLMMIPARVAIALQTDGWWLRSESIWFKPNCLPESVEDRPTKSHEYIYLLSKSSSYYYDADAIREPLAYPDRTYGPTESHKTLEIMKQGNRTTGGLHDGRTTYANPLGRNKRSVWSIPTSPFPASHFATFPPKLVETCLLAGSQPGDIVLDCFMGAGTTALVAIQHSRNYLGIELNEAYVKLAEKRIQHVQQHLWTGEGIA